jgi:hypothetical protein
MERNLREVNRDIRAEEERRDRLAEELAQVTHRLLFLGSEKNAIMAGIASRHLYVVPNVTPVSFIHPDGPIDPIA